MPLARGTRFGPFEIDALLGAGGMGEVYRARDTRLDRTVAIKVLPPHASSDPERRARFEREARAISTLNHANICTLHDIGRQNGVDYLVMELVDGETLAERIRRGPLPFGDVLRYGETLADALSTAHRHGIVHRDLKPGNVMVTRSGLKLLDFGLAKLRVAAAAGEGAAYAPTVTGASPLSGSGSVLGTFQYMSPEQLEGKEADARSDLWALGCVLYEMATGRRAFEGSSAASLTAAIIEKDPPSMVGLQPGLPPAFDRVVRRCLAKDPDERWQNARDLAFVLRSIAGDDSRAAPIARPARRPWIVAGTAALVAIAALVWGATRARPAAPPRQARFIVQLPAGERLPTAMQPALALSPDGRLLVYASERGNTSRLYLRWLDRLSADPIPGTEGAAAPFFSPDGQWVAFFAERKLKKVPVGGGAVIAICDAPPDAWGGSWGPDGTIVFNPGGYQGLSQVAASGGAPTRLTVPDKAVGDYEHEWPHMLPGGRAIVFSSWTGSTFDLGRVHVLERAGEGARPRRLIEGGFAPQYLPNGYLLYARRRGLFAVPFDASRLETTGAAVRVLEDVQTSVTGAVQAALAGDGTLAYVPGGPDRGVMRIDQSGARRAILDVRGAYTEPALSPDGTRLALSIESEKGVDIWVADLARGPMTRLTSGGLNGAATWSPDGKRIVFYSSPSGETGKIYWRPADGSAPAERLTTGELIHTPNAVSPDGRLLVWTEFSPVTNSDLWILPLHGDRKARPLVRTPASEDWAVFSPDGRYIAYVSDESGRQEVYVVNADGSGAKWPISVEGGREPHWIGDQILYRNGDRVMSVAVRTRPAFSADKPRVRYEGWFEACALPGCRTFDVTRDGDLIVLAGDRGPATEIHVVLGWFRDVETALSGVPAGGRR